MHVLKTLAQANFESWFVGGCVRDVLLKKSLVDYDIATRAKPDDVVRLFSGSYELDQKGKKYGCIRLYHENTWYDITSLRKDVNQDGRHTGIIYTDNLEDDASRRDFTINALYWNEAGITDFFDGQEDLKAGRVRFIGDADQRIQEDYLRILRFLRFSGVYADEFDGEGVSACVKNQTGLQYLSGERVWQEWQKTLLQKNSLKVLELMATKGIDVTLFGGKFELQHYLNYCGKDCLLLTHLLLPFVHVEHLAHRLSLGARNKMWLEAAENLSLVEDFREIYLKFGKKTKELVWYWACKYGKNADDIFNLPFWQVENPSFPLKGNDILNLGCQPGPIVGNYLEHTRAWWVKNNFVPKYEDCLIYAKSLFNN